MKKYLQFFQELGILLLTIFVFFLQVFMTGKIVSAFMPSLDFLWFLGAIPLNVILLQESVKFVRIAIPFQTENARNWALVRGDDVFKYWGNWMTNTHFMAVSVILCVQFVLYLIFV